MGKLVGKTAIVTGGARGMGASHVRALAAEGARVVIGDILEREGAALAEELGGDCRFITLDVREPDHWANAVALAEDAYGSLDILVNNAGVTYWRTLSKTSLEDFRRVIDINLTGVFIGMHAAVPAMRRAGGGVIVNISSTAGLAGFPNAAYVASKFGVTGLTKAGAMELGPDNIRVVSVHPGPITTPMTQNVTEHGYTHQPLARMGEPEEVSKLVVYLVADATYSTGCEFVVDGGALLAGPPRWG